MKCGICKELDVTIEHVRICSRMPVISSIDDVELLLQEPVPSFRALLDAISVSKGGEHWRLLDRCIQVALAAITGEVPPQMWRPVVLEAALAKLQTATYIDLMATARLGAAELRESADDLPDDPAKQMRKEAEKLDDLTLVLAEGTSAALTSACSLLRSLNRPDLGRTAASKAIEIEERNLAARTTRAAAAVDEGEVAQAMVDIEFVDQRDPSAYIANVMSRAKRADEDLEDALEWAMEANRRDPEGVAGMFAVAAAAKLLDDHDMVAWAVGHFREGSEHRSRSEQYTVMLAAVDLIRAGNRGMGEKTLRGLSESGYEPARRKLLEVQSRVSR